MVKPLLSEGAELIHNQGLSGWSQQELSYLDKKKGHPVGAQGPRQLHVLHFGFDFTHLTTVFVLL